MNFLELKELRKVYPDGTEAVKGIDLSIDEGEFIVLLGPSGCGKTTTLRMIAGLEIATEGKVLLGGHDVTTLRPSQRDVGMVFQFYALYPHMTVRDNIEFPLINIGMQDRKARMDEVVRRIGIGHLLDRYPKQLSGGDQQRVSLARAMVRRPKVFLMDEPLGTLDADQRLEMRDFIRNQQLQERVTTIYVTHDQEEAMSLADRMVVMDQGRILQVGPPSDVYENPVNLFVANFVGSPGMNFVDGEVLGGFFEPGRIPVKAPTGRATLGIRSEYIVADPNGPISGRVVMDEYMGSFRSIHLQTAMGPLIMRAGEPYRVGDTLRLRLEPDHIRIFEPRKC